MNFQKNLRSNKGFSLVEMSVTMGLLGLATLAVMNLSENVTQSTRRAESMLSKSQFASALGGYMYSALACAELKGMTGFNSTPKEISLTNWKVAGVNSTDLMKDIGAGKEFKNFRLKSLTGRIDTTTSGLATVNIGGVNYTKTFLNVNAVVQVKQNPKADYLTGQGVRDYEYFYNVPVLADAGGKVAFCSEEKSIQETCASMKGVYNPATKQCDLEKTCKVQGAYSVLTCTPSGQTCSTSGGSPTNNALTGSKSCPSGSTAIQTGYKSWTHVGTCSGKKCDPPTVTDMLAFYSCLECPGLSGTTGTGGGGGTSGSAVGGGGGGGGCFVAGTQIHLYGGGRKNIEDVEVGDLLVDHKGLPTVVEVLKSYRFKGNLYSLNGGAYFFTPNHPFLTTQGWKSLDPAMSMKESPGIKVTKLKIGDVILKKSGYEVVKSLDFKPADETVYNFTVSDSHEYIAEDFAVHNIAPKFK